MFTPPPSPLPPVLQASEWDTQDSDKVQLTGDRSTQDTPGSLSKQRVYHTIRWTIVLLPFALMLLAAYTRFGPHPAAFDLLFTDGDHARSTWANMADWSLHEPHKPPSNRMVKRSPPSRPVAREGSTPVPTVPTNPVLPTPFPQPFDTTLSANFSTTSCYDFFLNMTQVDAFRTCRPFSLLISSSHAFEMAQDDINLMNTDVWGTCNTETSQVQCDANMSWFASSLQSSCQTDLANQVATAVSTLNALRAYDLMRDVACQVNPATNSYCFVEAVANSDPSSYWFYQLPVGLPLGPKVTASTCNECTSGVMAAYASVLSKSNGSSLTGLAQTYNNAVDVLNKVCGSMYAKNAQVSTSSSAWVNAGVPRTIWLVALSIIVFACVLCGS